jgi:hypothetical protein
MGLARQRKEFMKLCIAYASGGMKMLATVDQPNEYVAHVFNKGDGDFADEILQAVNAHDDLVASNKKLRDRIEEMKQSGLAMLEHEAKRTRECLELRDQVQQLIDALKPLIEIAEEHCDAGPHDEGWQSDELLAKIAFANAALAAAGAA